MLQSLYPGTFDPFTLGHFDMAQRALKISDVLIIAVAESQTKKPKFSLEQRINFIKTCFENELNTGKVKIIGFQGLLKDLALKTQASIIIRGLRTTGDFEYEMQLAKVNQMLMPQIETIFLTPQNQHQMISSTLVRELLFFKQDISAFVPHTIASAINQINNIKHQT